MQGTEDVAERAMNGRLGRRDRPEVLRLALVEDVLNDRQRLLLDAAKVVAPLEALRVELVDIFGAPRDAPRTSSQGHLANLTSRTSAVDCLARWRPGDTSQTATSSVTLMSSPILKVSYSLASSTSTVPWAS